MSIFARNLELILIVEIFFLILGVFLTAVFYIIFNTPHILTASDRNRRIARNTVMLYIRTLLTTVITLYTSRVVLAALGVEDYGIYDVVGGVVVMLSFFVNSLSATTQRFLNYEMGLGNSRAVKNVFSTALTCHLLIALLIVVAAETAGLWFVKNRLIIPAERLHAAIWVYHFSIATMLVAIAAIPCNAMIIAHERMNIYAYASIADAVMKLIIVYLLQMLRYDKLVMYGALMLVVTVFTNGIYVVYCRQKFRECRFTLSWNKTLMKKLMGFSGWMVAGASSNMLAGQGVNMLINIFFGPVFNATRNIAKQVHAGAYMLTANIITAVRPQIIKSYSQHDYKYMYRLVFSASKLAFLLLYIVALPILLHTEYILQLWLKQPPQFTAIFVQIILVDMLVQASYISIASISQASGKIKRYQIIIAAGFLSEFCLSALFFKLGYPVYSTFMVALAVSFLSLFTRLLELRASVGFPVRKFLLEVSARMLLVAILAAIAPLAVTMLTSFSIFRFFAVTALSVLSTLAVSWFTGFGKWEKELLKQKIRAVFMPSRHHTV